MVVSLDFELYWGMRHLPWVKDYVPNLVGARAAVPAILDLFKEYGIHATWAIVGFLFFEQTSQLLSAMPACRPRYKNPRLSAYDDLPSPTERENSDSIYFASGLIRPIAVTPNQEIATHSFSHYYCLEEGADIASFKADLEAALSAGRASNLIIKSLVFPNNEERRDFLVACGDIGIVAYRANPSSWLYRAASHSDQTMARRIGRLLDAYIPLSGDNCGNWPMVDDGVPARILASRFLRPYSRLLRLLEPIRLRRIKKGLTAAAKKAQLYHLWWHPHDFGRDLAENCRGLRQILDHYLVLHRIYGMESLNMAEVANRCLGLGYPGQHV
jgi:peptidoglycan/xylan/chitin deacetylase (PgdA/CDA1 family)